MDLLLCEKAFAAASLVTTHPPSAAALNASAVPTCTCSDLLLPPCAALREVEAHAENVAMAPEEKDERECVCVRV